MTKIMIQLYYLLKNVMCSGTKSVNVVGVCVDNP